MNRETIKLIAGIVLIAGFSLLLRLANYSHEPIFDELYHVLAGASWSESGTFAIADGEYTRASVYTRMVGMIYGATDGNLDAIRLLNIAIGSILVVTVFLGVRLLVGTVEAYVAAIMLAMMPSAIFLSQFIRFYSLHALAFWLAAISIYVLFTKHLKTATKWVLCTIVVILVVFASHLQVTTVIGGVGLGIWVAAVATPAVWRWFDSKQIAIKVTCIIAALIVVLCSFMLMGPSLIERYQDAPLWNSETHAGYYFILFRNQFGAFWSLFPIAVVISLLAKPRQAFFFACVFSVVFLLHTFASMRAERYLFYAMPFFATTWAIAITDISRRLFRQITDELLGRDIPGSRVIRKEIMSVSVLAILLACAVLMTPATEITVRMVFDKPSNTPTYWHYHITSWNAAKSKIKELVNDSEIFLTSQAYHAIYYIGDFDVEVSANGPSEIKSVGGGAIIDPRTGREVIDKSSSLREMFLCNTSGVIVVSQRHWRLFSGVSDDVADFIEVNMSHVDTPEEWGMVIYQWNERDTVWQDMKTAAVSDGTDCL